jgi:hypothetical protein
MENCDWLKKVIPDFVQPYLLKTGKWTEVERDCAKAGSGYVSDRRCAERMARTHIRQDLSSALVASGCGSDIDWQKVFLVIEKCTAEAFTSRFDRFVASSMVSVYRESVRAQCLKARSESGLPTHINDELKGQTCTP